MKLPYKVNQSETKDNDKLTEKINLIEYTQNQQSEEIKFLQEIQKSTLQILKNMDKKSTKVHGEMLKSIKGINRHINILITIFVLIFIILGITMILGYLGYSELKELVVLTNNKLAI